MIICYLDYDIKSSFKELAFVIVPLSSVSVIFEFSHVREVVDWSKSVFHVWASFALQIGV